MLNWGDTLLNAQTLCVSAPMREPKPLSNPPPIRQTLPMSAYRPEFVLRQAQDERTRCAFVDLWSASLPTGSGHALRG